MKYNRELLEIKSSFCILSQTGRACLDAPMQSFIPKNWRELQKVAPIFFLRRCHKNRVSCHYLDAPLEWVNQIILCFLLIIHIFPFLAEY
jgi:hypothetical protein